MSNTVKPEHLQRLTKDQLIEELIDATKEIASLSKWDGVDKEARAFHECVTALDRLTGNNTRMSSSSWMGERVEESSVARVLGYLAERYGIQNDATALRQRLAEAEQEAHEARSELAHIRSMVSGGGGSLTNFHG